MSEYDKILQMITDLEAMQQKEDTKRKKSKASSIANLKRLALEIGKDQALAKRLYATGMGEARKLAYLISEPKQMTDTLVLKWANDFTNKEMCDLACEFAFFQYKKIHRLIPELIHSPQKYTRRAAFELIALLAMHGKGLDDKYFEAFIDKNTMLFDEKDLEMRKEILWGLSYIARRNDKLKQKVKKFAEMLHFAESENSQWLSDHLLKQI